MSTIRKSDASWKEKLNDQRRRSARAGIALGRRLCHPVSSFAGLLVLFLLATGCGSGTDSDLAQATPGDAGGSYPGDHTTTSTPPAGAGGAAPGPGAPGDDQAPPDGYGMPGGYGEGYDGMPGGYGEGYGGMPGYGDDYDATMGYDAGYMDEYAAQYEAQYAEMYGADYGMPGDYGADYEAAYGSEYGTMPDEYGDMYQQYGGGYGPGRQQPEPDDYEGRSELAFQQGRDRDGMQYLYAHILTQDEAVEVLGQMGWVNYVIRPQSPTQSRRSEPRLVLRWGVGVDVSAPPNVRNVYPVGTTQNLPGSQGRGGGGGQYGGGYGDVQGGMGYGADYAGQGGQGQGGQRGMHAELKTLTGELGERLLEGLIERLAEGAFGEPLRQMNAEPQAGRGGGAAAYGYDEYGMDYGGMPGYGPPPGGSRGQAPGSDGPVQLAPGVLYLGVHAQDELLELAKEQELDFLVVYQLRVGAARRTNMITNNTDIRLFDVASRWRLYGTGTIANVRVQREREGGSSGQDSVETAFNRFFEFVDENLTLQPIPEGLNSENVKGRAAMLFASSYENPLPVLSELKFYHTRDLITDDQLAIGYSRLIGEEQGRTLAGGAEEDRKQVLQPWLPERDEPAAEGAQNQSAPQAGR